MVSETRLPKCSTKTRAFAIGAAFGIFLMLLKIHVLNGFFEEFESGDINLQKFVDSNQITTQTVDNTSNIDVISHIEENVLKTESPKEDQKVCEIHLFQKF